MRASILLLLLLFPFFSAGAEEFNAGIVQGLWYSDETIFEGDTVRIYVAIRNNTGSDLSGTVEFKDGQTRIERQNVQALNGRIIESWADWTPSYGTHTISATLSRIALHAVGSSTQEVSLTSTLADDTFFVDHDTDDDNVGNEGDTDDDDDGISDVQEQKNGTDPLTKETAVVTTEDRREDSHEEDSTAEDESANEPEGLERYLAESPAEDVLSSVTTFINDAKENLDGYRAERAEKKQASTTAPDVNGDGFGAVTRSSSSESSSFKELSLTDFFASVFNLAKALFDAGYTLLLAALSFVLAHPVLVQLGILLLILFLLIKLAAQFGRRPKKI